MKNLKHHWVVVATGCLLTLALLFNNCGDPHIEFTKVNSFSTPSIEGHLCINPTGDLTPMQMDSFVVTNVTATFKGELLTSDSDVDGVPDELESNLGYDPQKRRSDGKRIDGICRLLGGPDKCQALNVTSCSSQVNAQGLSECDIKALNLQLAYAHPDQGIDSDKDGVSDFTEISRATDPSRNDSSEDPDGDSKTNQVEFAQGTNPRDPDTGQPPKQKVDFMRDDIDECPGGAFKFSIRSLAFVDTKAYVDADSPKQIPTAQQGQLNFTHGAGENLILITYRSTPTSQQVNEAQVWGVMLKLSYEANNSLKVRPNDFRLLGKILK